MRISDWSSDVCSSDLLEIADAFFAASRSGDMGALGALLAADVGMWSDGGGKRPAAMEPVLGYDIVLKLHRSLAVLFGIYGSTLVHTGMINGLPGLDQKSNRLNSIH